MANGTKRFRGSNWSHEETMVLAELKKEAFLNEKEGKFVWIEISQTISSRFPEQKRSHDQCRRRWETLSKIYNHIEEYCMETGQDHLQLDEDELSSMKLDTSYRQDWYDVVKQVCSQRKRKEKGDRDLMAAKRSKRSDTCSPSSVFPEPTLGRENLYVTPPASVCKPAVAPPDAHDHEQSATVNGQISIHPSLEVEKLSPEEDIRRLHTILMEKDALILQLKMRQNGQISQQDQAEQESEDFGPSDFWDAMDQLWDSLDSTPGTWKHGMRCGGELLTRKGQIGSNWVDLVLQTHTFLLDWQISFVY